MYLQGLVHNASKYLKDDLTLERMWEMLEKADNPHEKLHVVHIAGTSGKTSTCYYISSLLRASGKKVGLTVSPHIISVTERIQINTTPLSEESFCEYLTQFIHLQGESAKKQSYFEFMICFALWVFVQEKVDYAVVETGLGGRLDSTNVVTRPDKVCVITDIGFDHQHILGNTLDKIAAQKAGIIHEHNHVIYREQEPIVNDVIKKQMKLKKASFQRVDEKYGVEKQKLPVYQRRNFAMAKVASEYIAKRDGFKLLDIDPSSIVIPGRMHLVQRNDKTVLFDGAHNPQKMRALTNTITEQYPDQHFDIVLAMRASKDYRQTITELKPIARKIYCVELSDSSGFVQSVRAKELESECIVQGIQSEVCDTVNQALEKATTTPIFATGSLYFLKQLLS